MIHKSLHSSIISYSLCIGANWFIRCEALQILEPEKKEGKWLLTVFCGIKARERRTENFHKIPGIPEVHVHILEVGVNVITIPESKVQQLYQLIGNNSHLSSLSALENKANRNLPV